ncbi:MAG: MoaD/ThiS family protein [Armatimonadetes bacterium]|nr:MoaD/ThiS family protein [Armatimonadota bacterium]
MPKLHFAKAIQRHVACEPRTVEAANLAEALAAVFEDVPRLRNYLLDDQGNFRQHIEVFVDGQAVQKPGNGSATPLAAGSEVYVMQALSGG